MKKFFDSLLVSVLLVALISVTAWADSFNISVDITPGELNSVTNHDAEEYVHVDVAVDSTTVPDALEGGEEQRYEDVTHPVDDKPVPTAKPGDDVRIYYDDIAGYNKPSVSAAYGGDLDAGVSPSPIPGQTGVDDESSRNYFDFTMPEGNVRVNIFYAVPTKAPASTPGNILPPSPAYNSNEEEAPQSASTVPTEAPMSVLPANTITFGGAPVATTGDAYNSLNGLTKNNANKFSATVLNLEARDLSNQNGLAAYYAAIEGKEADILATYGVYASKDLSAEDNGKLTSLTWKNITAEKLDKNTKIKAVCYNLVDGTYTIEGEIDEFGNIILKNFIIRPTKTNITVFICK